eukprot:GHVO01033098.1.p1 GENE.GHVO01033098.1~~GHVO01033098.1.p1  ORF type:complete len:187 (+),score=8.28 GHVO01033098.1:501-1061(+)
MAFADDIKTVADSGEIHDKVMQFLAWAKLEANPSKCAYFASKDTKKADIKIGTDPHLSGDRSTPLSRRILQVPWHTGPMGDTHQPRRRSNHNHNKTAAPPTLLIASGPPGQAPGNENTHPQQAGVLNEELVAGGPFSTTARQDNQTYMHWDWGGNMRDVCRCTQQQETYDRPGGYGLSTSKHQNRE